MQTLSNILYFIPKEENGSFSIDFTFDARGLEGKSVVIFQVLYLNGKKVTYHGDINNKNQPVPFKGERKQDTNTISNKGNNRYNINDIKDINNIKSAKAINMKSAGFPLTVLLLTLFTLLGIDIKNRRYKI